MKVLAFKTYQAFKTKKNQDTYYSHLETSKRGWDARFNSKAQYLELRVDDELLIIFPSNISYMQIESEEKSDKK